MFEGKQSAPKAGGQLSEHTNLVVNPYRVGATHNCYHAVGKAR